MIWLIVVCFLPWERVSWALLFLLPGVQGQGCMPGCFLLLKPSAWQVCRACLRIIWPYCDRAAGHLLGDWKLRSVAVGRSLMWSVGNRGELQMNSGVVWLETTPFGSGNCDDQTRCPQLTRSIA